MHKAILVTVVVLVCLPALLSAAGGGRRAKAAKKAARREEAADQQKDCGPWVDGQCIVKDNGTCGHGTMTKTRTGDNCPVKEKMGKCKIACAGGAARGQGVKAGNKKACKYAKGEWSECDTTTNTKTRTLTLKTSRRNNVASSECEPTTVVTKRCTSVRKNQRGGK